MNGPGQLEIRYRTVSDLYKPEYLPKYASEGAAGLDLHACIAKPLTIRPGERVRVPTGIAIQLPNAHTVALVYARSGLAWRHGVGLPNGVGVIDSDYTGEVQVLLTNFSNESFTIQPGDRVAQLVIAPIFLATFLQVETLNPTERGPHGFGSTGVSAGP